MTLFPLLLLALATTPVPEVKAVRFTTLDHRVFEQPNLIRSDRDIFIG